MKKSPPQRHLRRFWRNLHGAAMHITFFLLLLSALVSLGLMHWISYNIRL